MNRNNQKENAAYGQTGEQNNSKNKNGKNKKNAGRDAKLQHIEVAEAGQTATVTATYRMEEQDADLQTLYKIT